MGRVSPSKQNQSGKGNKPGRFVPQPQEKPQRTRAQIRRSSTPAAIERATSGTGNPTRPSQPTNGQVVPAIEAPPVISRGEVRTNANGVVQTGTNTGVKPMTLGDANALLSGGYQIQDPFSSNQLPTTSSSLYQKPPETTVYEQNPEYNISTESTPTKLSENIFESGSAIEMTDVGDNYQVSAEQSPNQQQSPANTTEKQNLARRRAFLDGGVGSMQALRRAEATQGLVYAGGQHHIRKGDELHAIDNKDDVRGYKSGRLSAQDMLNKHINAVTETNNQSPQVEQPAAVSPADLMQQAPEGFNTESKPKTRIQIPYNK